MLAKTVVGSRQLDQHSVISVVFSIHAHAHTVPRRTLVASSMLTIFGKALTTALCALKPGDVFRYKVDELRYEFWWALVV